jgi:hypothetical protein
MIHIQQQITYEFSQQQFSVFVEPFAFSFLNFYLTDNNTTLNNIIIGS